MIEFMLEEGWGDMVSLQVSVDSEHKLAHQIVDKECKHDENNQLQEAVEIVNW